MTRSKKQRIYRYSAYRGKSSLSGGKHGSRSRAPWILLVLVAAMAITAFKLANSSQATAKSEVLASHTITQSRLTAMGQQINQTIDAHPSVQTAVAIIDLGTGASYNYGTGSSFEAASVSKLITAALFLHQVESGQQSLSKPVRNSSAKGQLQLMIEQSDNNAWQSFNDMLGHPALESWAQAIGFSDYDADANTLPASDVALLLNKLYLHKLLNKTHTDLLLSFMQNANETAYIVSDVPSGVKVYHKAGWLDDRVNDAAIIDNGKNPYVLVIFTKVDGTYDSAVGMQMFKDITGATVKAFLNS